MGTELRGDVVQYADQITAVPAAPWFTRMAAAPDSLRNSVEDQACVEDLVPPGVL